MRNLESVFLGIAEWWARKRHREFDVVLDNGKVEIESRKPVDTKRYHWDDQNYSWGNVHFKGKAQAAIPSPNHSQDAPEFVPSDNFSAALIANDLIPKALSPGLILEELKKWVLVSAGAAVLAVVVAASIHFVV